MHTPTHERLFIQAPELDSLFEKSASIARMPDDEKRWPTQILSELYKQLPFMSKLSPEIVLDRLDAEAGYALGYVQVRNLSDRELAQESIGKASNKVRIPIIVSDRQLQPFHTFELGKKQYPLTKNRVEAAMMNPAMFDGTSDPPGKTSLVDQINPPYQQRQGFGMQSGGDAVAGLSKLSSATKTAGINFSAATAGRTRKLAPGLKKAAEDLQQKKASMAGNLDGFAASTPTERKLRAGGHGRLANMVGGRGLLSTNNTAIDHNVLGQKVGSICSKIAGTLNPTDFARFEAAFKDPATRYFVEKNASVQAALHDLLSEPMISAKDLKQAAVRHASMQRADVIQIVPDGDGYKVKYSSAPFDMAPQTAQMSPEQAGQAMPPDALQTADQTGAATLTGVEATPDPLVEHPMPITGFGMYKVMEATTGKQMIGYVIPGLIDPRTGQPSPMSLFCNGSQFALQPSIVGILVNLNFNLPATSAVRGLGIFYKTDGRSLSATVPFQIITEMTVEGKKYYAAKAPDGTDVQIVMVNGMKQPFSMTAGMATGGAQQPGVDPAAQQQAAPAGPPAKLGAMPSVEVNIHNGKKDGDKKDGKASEKKDDKKPESKSSDKKPAASAAKPKAPAQPQTDAAMAAPPAPQGPQEIAIPADWHFLALDNPVQLEAGQSMQQGALPMKTAQADAWSTMCEIRAWDTHGCKLSGPVFDKIGSGEHSWVDGIFWLAAAGMPQNMSVPLLEKAASSGRAVRMFGLQPLHPLSETVKAASLKAMDDLFKTKLPQRVCLLKEAAALSDTSSVDAVLALNFINPENISTFIENLPELEDASTKLAALVLATQLGLQSIPKTAAVRAMFALEDVITGLKSMKNYPI